MAGSKVEALPLKVKSKHRVHHKEILITRVNGNETEIDVEVQSD